VRIEIEISPGELLDKLTILEIKEARIDDPMKLENIRRERAALAVAASDHIDLSRETADLKGELKSVNERLWLIEDNIRAHERDQDFGPSFVELARSVYLTNDRRAALKKRINEILGSDIAEEKSYTGF